MRYLQDKYEEIDKVLECEAGQHPSLLKEFLGKKITAETVIVFDNMFGVFGDYDEMNTRTISSGPLRQNKLNKLKPFIEYEQQKLRISNERNMAPQRTS